MIESFENMGVTVRLPKDISLDLKKDRAISGGHTEIIETFPKVNPINFTKDQTTSEGQYTAKQQPQLLLLPGELRNLIWRYAVLNIDVFKIGLQGVDEPGLLLASKQIRREAASIFFKENKFELTMANYETANLIRWTEKIKAMRHRGEIRGLAYSAAQDQMTPHWANLVEWLKRVHNRSLSCRLWVPSELIAEGKNVPQDMILGGLFSIVTAMRQQASAEVEKLLLQQRIVLASIDRRWNDEH